MCAAGNSLRRRGDIPQADQALAWKEAWGSRPPSKDISFPQPARPQFDVPSQFGPLPSIWTCVDEVRLKLGMSDIWWWFDEENGKSHTNGLRLPEGKFSVRSGTLQMETVILAGQVLERRARGQLIHALRKRKATDAYSRLEDLGRTARLADDIWCDDVTPTSRYVVTSHYEP